jgi:uncharacterized membrane protein YfcA
VEPLLTLLMLAAVGFVAGTVNTIAGGGSLLTLPALIFFGLPPGVANGTNRLGVIVQSLVATWRFQRGGALMPRVALRLAPPVVAGGIAGALVSVRIDDETFQTIIGVAMLIMVAAVLLRPRRWIERWHARTDRNWWKSAAQCLLFAALGFYAGFLQAGVGIFALALIVLTCGTDLLRGNAIKTALVAAVTIPALLIFLWQDLVAWGPGLCVASGQAAGGWVGARLTMRRGENFVRWILGIVVVISATKLLGMW